MKHLKLFFALFAMLALGVGNAWGAETLYKNALFKIANCTSNSSYTGKVTCTIGDDSWVAQNAANNNGGWDYVKIGAKKSKASDPTKVTTGTITTNAAYAEAVSKIVVNGKKDRGSFTSKLIIASNSSFTTDKVEITGATSFTNNQIVFEIASPSANKYYKLEFVCSNTTTSNGVIQVSSVEYYYEPSTEETVVSVPTFSVPEGTFYSPINVELSCSTADAEIHYTLDGSTPSSTSEKYTTAIAISETTTVKAIAVKDGLTNSEVATATYTKGETVTSYDIDFETNALEAYVNWDFSNITITTATIKAKAGTYYANTSGKASASIKTKEKIQYPGILTFSVSKESTNTTASNWLVQVSENGTTWSTVGTISATEMTKGSWKDHSVDLSGYENVYVQISYGSSTAVRAIDEISLAQGVAPVKYTLTIESPENGTLLVTNGGASVASGDQFKAGTSLVVTPTPNAGYVFESLTVDGTPVDLTEGSYNLTMPAANVTIAAIFKENEKSPATLTLSKNGVDETFPGSWKQDDVVTLPSITSDCVKEFVGWSTNPTCNVAPEYAAGDSYILTATAQTLYAVYATAGAGETLTITPSAVDNDAENDIHTFTIDAAGYSLTAKKNSGTSAPAYPAAKDVRIYAKGTLTLTAPKALNKIVFNLSEQGKKRLAPITASVGAIATQASGDATVTWTGDATEVTFTVGDNANYGSESDKAGQLCFGTITVTTAGSYSNYSTTCATAPIVTVTPETVTANSTGAEGKVTVTYENVNTENVAVALFNDAACTEAFNAGWLTASFDGDKNITYTVAENTTYAERKAYIKLTAPETTGATDPDVVVIPVTQAAKDKVFASLAELVAADLTAGDEVTVTLNNDIIKEFYIYSSKRCGVVFDVQKDGKDIKIYFNSQTTIDDWAVGGKLSGTLTNVKWTTYSSAWQLAPANTWAWANLTYTEPKAVSTVVVSGAPTKTTYVDGEAFDPAGLTITVNYNDATSEVNPTGVTFAVTPATLVKGQTSVSVTATYNSVTSAAYEVTGLTVNDIPTKTVAEFIEAEGGRCYLEGIVSGLTEGNSMKYGNFDLTDASGKIYVYGCLNAAGESQKFADLGVKNGDKIKVIADEYKLYEGTKQEAIDVQYVSHISAATITIADITMEVGETKTIAATVVPAEAEVTYTIKENEASAISLSGNTITALAEGTATITAIVAEGATYLSNSVVFTVTVGPKNIATLPFAFDGGVNDIKNTLGMSHKNLGTDYSSSPKLKFDDKDDYVIIHFDERPGILSYDIKANTGSGAFSGEFAVQESADGVTYRDLVKYSTISGSKETKTHNCFDKDTRYIKFILATKDNGNVALGNIKIETSVVTKVTPTIVENAYFSVGNNKYVQFSTGNLQYEVGTNTWSFASKQYEVIGGEAYTGSNNTNYGMNVPGYTGKLDLFAWSCDGKFGVNPSNADDDYKGEFADWGDLVKEAGWSTLTRAQMEYLLERKKDGKKLWGLATLEGKVALILLPDNWNTAIEFTYGYVPTKWNFTANELTEEEWNILETNGAVLLPAGGSRAGGSGNKIGFDGKTVETDATKLDANGDYFQVDNVGDYGYYWLSSTAGELADYLILPASDNTGANTYSPDVWSREKRRGNSVRLVKEVKPDYTRKDQGAGVYGTVCYPENIVWCDGATLYEVAGREGDKVIFDEVTTPKAGMPYIFIADQEKVNFFCGTEYEGTAGKHKSLQGTFTKIEDGAEGAFGNILEGNYVLYNNIIKKCGAYCGLYANRAYFVATELENMGTAPAAVQGRRRISLNVTSENTTTGLDNITNGENTTIKVIENGQLIIIRNGEKFNAQGVRF